MKENKEVYVYLDQNADAPKFMGTLYCTNERGKENYAFEYEENWLKTAEEKFIFDPDLYLYGGRQFMPLDKAMFGFIADSCPERWGRMLMKRREVIAARKEERKPRKMMEADYLLGVHDETRMGALRFKLDKEGPFLSEERELAAPPWTTLRKLETASLAFENDETGLEEKWLEQLLAPGSSLGGARPKASVLAPDNTLWIAKFPSKHDENNSGAWEMVIHELAARCGLNVPEARLENFSDAGSTFLVKRFDRVGSKRIHFASAMTLLGKTDGADGSTGTSYLDLASFIRSNSMEPKLDLFELWKRLVFTVAVSNTDDHLRNHGFILDKTGWRLSPLYDVNPSIYGENLSLNITTEDNTLDFGLVLETAEYYDIDLALAKELVHTIRCTVRNNWKSIAAEYKLGRGAVQYMEPAFSLC